MCDGLAAGDRVQLHINNGKKKAYIRNGQDWIKRFPVGRSAAFCPGRVKVCFWQILLQSLFGGRTKFLRAADALHARRDEGPYRFMQNRSRASVTALKSDAATE